MQECLALVRKGVPFDVAFSLPGDMRTAFLITFGQIEGGTWNWEMGEWERKNA